jgi:hypothetical protein
LHTHHHPGEAVLDREKGVFIGVLGRIEALEKRPAGMVYKGVWAPEIGYPANSVVTHSGTAWIAMEPSHPSEKPGAGGPWKMIAKGDEAALRRMLRDELRKGWTAA